MLELNKVYNEDCIEGIKKIDVNSIDLTVTSPPYDNLRSYRGAIDCWNFDKFKILAQELYRVTKDGGVVVWNVNDQTENGTETGTSFKQALYFMEVGFNLNDTMIWRKPNPVPPVPQPRYVSSFEYMFVFSKGAPKTFNPIMRKTVGGGKWFSGTCKNIGDETGRTYKVYRTNAETVDYNVWDIKIGGLNETGHPAIFPLELPEKHIKSWSNPGDTVLDPFMGSGTTAVAAIFLDRNYLGFEVNEEFYGQIIERLKDKEKIKSELEKMREEQTALF